MKNIEIKIFKETRMVELNKFIIGNDGENLQGNLVFTFDEFVDGQARLEYVIDGNKNYIVLEKVGETYQVPVLSVITKKGQIDMQVVVTQGTEDVAIFKSNLFYLTCNASINAEIEQPEEYMQWIEVANAKLNEIDNLDIDAVKENGVATITITKKDGTQESFNLYDGEGAITNYEMLDNKPSINGVELVGDKTLEELNIQEKGDYLTSENDPLFKQSASYGITSQDIKNWNNKSEFSGNYDDLNGKPTIPTKTSQLINDSGFIDEPQDISGKQDKLISGETIKTINNQSLLGSGNITITSEDGTTDYNALDNRPKINNVTLSDNKTLDELGIQPKGDYVKETDYATREKAGLIRGNLNTNTDVWQDYLYGVVNSYEQYQEKDRTAFVSKGTLDNVLEAKNYQDELVSGENIKTINGTSLLGSGNITITGGSGGESGKKELIIFGDSWSDANVTNSIWGAIVGNKLGLNVNNYAKSSAYMSGTDDISLQNQVTQFLNSSVDKTKVKYIVILGGVNDFRNNVTYSYLVTALTNEITRLESVCPQAKIVYISNTQYPYTEKQGVYWSGVHQAIRINTQITTLSLFNIMGRGIFDSSYFHLTQDGHRLLASNIISLLTGGEILEYQDLVLLVNGSNEIKYFTQRVGNIVHVGFSIYIGYGTSSTKITFNKATNDPNLNYAGSMIGSFMTNDNKTMEYVVSVDNITLTFNSVPTNGSYIKVSKVLPLYNPGLPY